MLKKINLFCKSYLLLILPALILLNCTKEKQETAPLGQTSFEQYQTETISWIENNRDFQTENREEEIFLNAPGEWFLSKDSPKKGIILVHGLGTSPWDFVDIAPVLAENGFLVRTVLLAGHSTKPADLIAITVDEWRQVISEQVAILSKEIVDVDIYLGGFSTGGNLVLEYAIEHPEIKGLLLFAPAIKLSTSFDFMAPFLSKFRKWFISPEKYRYPA